MKKQVVIVHPDLGIGGAERLILDVALSLIATHNVKIFTSHCSPSHSFPETQDGTFDVTVVGDFLPRHFFHRGYALFAYLRMFYVALYVTLFHSADVVICDSISFPIPLLKLVAPVIFYCHFPDKLLCTDRQSLLKRIYRLPLDWIEGITTKQANILFVNSKFTQNIFSLSFPDIRPLPHVLYPPLSLTKFDQPLSNPSQTLSSLSSSLLPSSTIPTDDPTWVYNKPQQPHQQPPKENFPSEFLLSINRFERKKNVQLALEAFAYLLKHSPSSSSSPSVVSENLSLILAGGYDVRVTENVEYALELNQLAIDLGIRERVFFLFSFSDEEKLYLLRNCYCVLYTPSNEHFGIVPVESMYCEVPVVAVNSGGPTESISHGVTGYLSNPDGESFGKAVGEVLGLGLGEEEGEKMRKEMGRRGRERVIGLFSLGAFERELGAVVDDLVGRKEEKKGWGVWGITLMGFLCCFGILLF